MKKLILILPFFLLGCVADPLEDSDYNYVFVPEELIVEGNAGLKLLDYIVDSEVAVNVKLPSSGTYKVRIIDFSEKIVSQEKLSGKEGDNILTVYVRTLPLSSYRIELLTEDGALLGREVFAIRTNN